MTPDQPRDTHGRWVPSAAHRDLAAEVAELRGAVIILAVAVIVIGFCLLLRDFAP